MQQYLNTTAQQYDNSTQQINMTIQQYHNTTTQQYDNTTELTHRRMESVHEGRRF